MKAPTTTKLIDIESLIFADNPRTESCMKIPEIVSSLKLHGYNDDRPLVVHEENQDGKTVFHVLRGNRRATGLQHLRDNSPEDYARVLSAHPGKVPCIVHKGLTPEMKTEIRIDHTPDLDRVALDSWSEYLAIGQLVAIGNYTEEAIAVKLGLVNYGKGGERKPRRSYVQARTALARMPEFVQEEIRKLCEDGRDSTNVRWSDVLKLYKVYNEEYIDNPGGDGPEFSKLWDKVMQPAASDTGNKPKELSPAEAIKRSQAASSDALKRVLLIATNQSTDDIREIDSAIAEGETAVKILAAIKTHLGDDDYNRLVEVALGVDTVEDTAPVAV